MRIRLRSGAVFLVVAAALLLAACSGAKTPSGSATSGSSSKSSTDQITISNFMFTPMEDTVAPGATVSVTNKDSVTHTLTGTGDQFNTGDIAQNETKTFKAPTRPGTYHYICNIHQYMMGTIIVR